MVQTRSAARRAAEREALAEELCSCCLVEKIRGEDGEMLGLTCPNDHPVCVPCVRELTGVCCPNCSCMTRLSWRCPQCRVLASLAPNHVLVLIKGSHAAANAAKARQGFVFLYEPSEISYTESE
jgi:hypothetical protein